MRIKSFVISIIVLLVVLIPLSSKAISRPSIDIAIGPCMVFPTSEYLNRYPGTSYNKNPPVRTSYYFNIDFNPFDIGFMLNEKNALSAAVGLSYLRNSQSLAYGVSILKGYEGIGFNSSLNYIFSTKWNMSILYRMLFCRSFDNINRFLVQELEFSPSYALVNDLIIVKLKAPICVSIKADTLSLKVGLAFSLGFSAIEVEKLI